MRLTKRILFTIACLPVNVWIMAQEPDSTDITYTIVDHIVLSGVHSVSQPDAMRSRLIPPQQMAQTGDNTQAPAANAATHTGGYRIQVFSDSNPRTARNEANAKAGNIASHFPEYRSYVTYDAPYWRLRIGDFRTYEDATDALEMLKETFPTYRRELRVVRDRINVN